MPNRARKNLRAALTTVEVDDGTRTYRVEPDVVLATMLPLTNTSAAPGLERYDPDRWVGRRLRDEAVLPAKELVATFGHGRHTCPAQRFSLSAIARTVRRLVDTYELEARFAMVRPYTDQIGGVARAVHPAEDAALVNNRDTAVRALLSDRSSRRDRRNGDAGAHGDRLVHRMAVRSDQARVEGDPVRYVGCSCV